MRYLLAIFIGCLTACASSQVNVDFDSCESRGIIDNVLVARCKKVKNLD